MAEHQPWGVEALWQDLEPLLPGLSIEVLARVESTNSALLERVRNEGRHRGEVAPYGRRSDDLLPCLLVAEHQTQGRGRMGRSWHSSPGASLTFSLALPMAPADWSGLSLAVGCALADALEPHPDAKPRLMLKWPNDIWLDGRKLGGVLIETVQAGAQRMVVVGVGLNVVPDSSANEAQFYTGYACLGELDPTASAPACLARVARPLIETLLRFQQQGFTAWREAYARRDLLRGRNVVAGTLDGVCQGVNELGELLIDNAQGRQKVAGGEVSVRLTQTVEGA